MSVVEAQHSRHTVIALLPPVAIAVCVAALSPSALGARAGGAVFLDVIRVGNSRRSYQGLSGVEERESEGEQEANQRHRAGGVSHRLKEGGSGRWKGTWKTVQKHGPLICNLHFRLHLFPFRFIPGRIVVCAPSCQRVHVADGANHG